MLLEFSCGAMLIDAGAQDATSRTDLINYLNTFFARRTDLHKTINTVLITHDHIDHDVGLRAVVENLTVQHYRRQWPGHWRGSTESELAPQRGRSMDPVRR